MPATAAARRAAEADRQRIQKLQKTVTPKKKPVPIDGKPLTRDALYESKLKFCFVVAESYAEGRLIATIEKRPFEGVSQRFLVRLLRNGSVSFIGFSTLDESKLFLRQHRVYRLLYYEIPYRR